MGYNLQKREKMTIEKLKSEIILKPGVKYFDFTASGLGLKCVESEISRILQTYGNLHSKVSANAIITSKYYENAVSKIKEILGVSSNFSLIPCGFGASEAIKRVQEIIGIYIPPQTQNRLNFEIYAENFTQNLNEILNLKSAEISHENSAEISSGNFSTNRPYKINKNSLPLVIISPFEHHSNEVSYRAGLCEVMRVRLDKNGNFDYENLEEILANNAGREIIGTFCVASNVTGLILDYKRVFLSIKSYGGTLILDASAILPHEMIDSGFYDALVFSPHKFLGGVGSCGLLVIKNELFKTDLPTFAGGGNVSLVNRTTQSFTIDKEALETPGTPPILELIRAYLALKIHKEIGYSLIKSRENELLEHFMAKISKIKDVKIYGPQNCEKVPIISLNVEGFDPYDFATILSQNYEIMTRAGCLCAGPYTHDLLGLIDNEKFATRPGFVRISINYTHEISDINYLVSAILEIINNKEKFKIERRVSGCCS